MAIIGLMGAMNVGKTAVLKMFVDYVEKEKIGKIDGGVECTIEKKDFKGESEIEVKDGEDFSKTITHNKVVFTDVNTGRFHTLFAPGGVRDSAVVRMGIITISRIARKIVGLFSIDESLEDQIKFYDLIRNLPKRVNIILTKSGKIPEYDLESILHDIQYKITNYFNSRKIIVDRFEIVFFDTDNPEFLDNNNEAIRMILNSVY